MEKMRAAVLESAKNLVIKEVDRPVGDGKNVIMKVVACGLCGSDVHSFWPNEKMAGMILGHEFCGTVEDPGARNDLKKGDRIVGMEINPCGECEYCKSGRDNLCVQLNVNAPGISRDGGYAEYVSIRPDMIRRLPDSISYIEGALIEPCSVSMHAVLRSGIKEGSKVLVSGGGAIGLFAAACAKIKGAGLVVLTEVDVTRKDIAEKAEFVDTVVDGNLENLSERLFAASERGFDVILESTSIGKIRTETLRTLAKNGRFVNIGFEDAFLIDAVRPMILGEYEITGSRFFMPADFDLVIALIEKGELKLEGFATPVKLEEIQSAFEDSFVPPTNAVKYVVLP